MPKKFVIRMRRRARPAQRGTVVTTRQVGRPVNRKYGKYRTRNSVVRIPGPSGFPPAMLVKLKYTTENINLSSPSTNFHWHTFNTNNLFDPDFSGIGHQPRLRDQLAVIYDKYRVWGCKVTVTGHCSSVFAIMGAGTRSGLIPQPVNVIDADELKNYTSWQISGQRPIKYSRYIKNPMVFGVTKANYAGDPLYGSTMNNSPPEVAHFDVGVASADGGGAAGSCAIRVELIYYCTLTEPKLVPIS